MAASMVPPVWACYQVRDEMTRTATCRIYSSQGRSLNTAEVRLRVRSIPRAGLERRTRSSSGEERFADGREVLRRLLRLDGEQGWHEQHGVRELPHRLELPPDLVGGAGHHERARHLVGHEVGDAAVVAPLDTLLELPGLGAKAVGGEVVLVLLDPTVEGHAGAGIVHGLLDVRVRGHPERGADGHVRALLASTCKSGLEALRDGGGRPLDRPDRMANEAVRDLGCELHQRPADRRQPDRKLVRSGGGAPWNS